MKYMTPELLAMTPSSQVEAEHGQLLFDATQAPLARIGSGNFVQDSPLFELKYHRAHAELNPDQYMPDGLPVGNYEDMPRSSVTIPTAGLLRLLSQENQPIRIIEDVMGYVEGARSHELIWTSACYSISSGDNALPILLREKVQLVVEGEYDTSAAVLCGDTGLPPRWLLGRNHTRTLADELPDELALDAAHDLAWDLGTDNLTFAELRAALWIANVVSRHFPPLVETAGS